MKKKVVLIGIILVLILIPIFLIILVKDDNMERKAYTNLGIVSTKKPFNTHLWWFHSTYGIVMVDSTNQTVLLHSTIARLLVDGNDWSVINLTDNTNSYKIQAGWLDGNDLWLVSCDNDGTADDFEVFFIELDDSNDCNPIDVSTGGDANSVKAFDIFKIGANFYVINKEDRTASEFLVVWDVDTNPFVEKSALDVGGIGVSTNDIGFGIVIGDDYHFTWDKTGGGNDQIAIENYDGIIEIIGAVPDPESFPGALTAYSLPNRSMSGITFDGIDTINYVVNKDSDGKNYLVKHVLTTEAVVLAEHNVAFMLDRNTASGILEKAFHITESSIYQLQTTITNQLHLIATPSTDAVWIAITQTLLMNDDGDMYEFEDINAYITECVINMKKMGHWTATMSQLDTYPIEKGMFVVIRDRFTTAANSPFLYRGTYNFKDELGIEGTAIGFVDSATIYDGECIIVSEWQGHKNVLRLQDDVTGGEDPFIGHNIVQATSGSHEFWAGTNDVTGIWRYGIFENGVGYMVLLRITASKFQYRDSVGVWQDMGQVAVNDTLYHIKIVWYADNTFDTYINGIQLQDGIANNNNQVSGVDVFFMEANGDSIDYSYLDAYGETENPSYTVGDNNYVAEGEDQIIFEGYVGPFTKRFIQDVQLVSPAKRDLDEEFPDGDYSGRTDQIIVLLLADHGDYITAGTMSAGMAMGTITFSGDKSLREIFDEFALQDNFIWSLNPVGVMTYNNGTTDSLILLNASSPIYNVNKTFGERALNYINIKGGFVGGAQVVGTPAQNIPGQQTNGRLPFEQTFSHLDLAAQCTTTNTNILSRLGTQPLIVPFTHKDSLIGVIQVGELVTFEYDLTDPNIGRFQGLILDCIYDAKQGKGNYRISDIVI